MAIVKIKNAAGEWEDLVSDSLEDNSPSKALSAKQGKVLDESKADKSDTYTKTEVNSLSNGKIDKPTSSTPAGKFMQTDDHGNAIWGDGASGAEVGRVVTEWLEENISGGQTVAIDTSLSVEGAAAESATVGNLLDEIIQVADEEPTDEFNKIWVEETPDSEIEIPDYEDFENLVTVSSDEPTAPANKVWIKPSGLGEVAVTTYEEFTGVVAPDYDTINVAGSMPIKVGQHCIHNGEYYSCKIEITEPETFTLSHWTKMTVGSEASDLKSAINDTDSTFSDFLQSELGKTTYAFISENNKAWSTSENPVKLDTPNNTAWKFCKIPCAPGDVFHVNINAGTTNYRPWAFVDASMGLLSKASSNVVDTDITAPENAAYLLCNVRDTPGITTGVHKVTKGNSEISSLKTRMTTAEGNISNNTTDITEISTTTDGIRKVVPNFVEWQLNKAVVTNVDTVLDPIDETGRKCIVLDLEGIDCVTLVNGYGNSKKRPWCFIDNSGNKIQIAQISIELFVKLYKPTGATKLVLNSSIESGAFAVIGEYVEQQSVIDIESANGIYGNFEKYMSIGGWSVTGFINRHYRLYSKPYITLGFDATVKCKTGYKIGVLYNDSGTMKDSGWQKAFKIPANTPFIVNVAKDPEDTTITANVHEFSMSFTLERTVNPLASNVFITDKDMIAMHRGYMGDQTNIPENSVPAFEKSGEMGAWMIETDIQETSDGYFVLMHDDTVDRTTTGTGTIASMTYAQTQALNLVGGDGTLKIPTLQQCLAVCKELNLRATLEIKSILNGTTSLRNILEIVKGYGMLDKVIFTFNSFTELEYFRTLNEDIPVMFNEDTVSDYETAIATAQKYIKCGIAYRIQKVDDVYYPTEEINIKCHKNNLFVVGWTSSDWDAQKVWFAKGCDIVVSNSNVKRQTES